MHQKTMDYTRNEIAKFVEIAVSQNVHTIQRVKLNYTVVHQVEILFNGSNQGHAQTFWGLRRKC